MRNGRVKLGKLLTESAKWLTTHVQKLV